MGIAELLQHIFGPSPPFNKLLEELIIRELQAGKSWDEIKENFPKIIEAHLRQSKERLKGPQGKRIMSVIFRRAQLAVNIGKVLKNINLDDLQYPE